MPTLSLHAPSASPLQLLGDEQRGFAWTRALLGLPANTIHVCGDTSAVHLVKHLAALCGDEFELHTYERCAWRLACTSGYACLPAACCPAAVADAHTAA